MLNSVILKKSRTATFWINPLVDRATRRGLMKNRTSTLEESLPVYYRKASSVCRESLLIIQHVIFFGLMVMGSNLTSVCGVD